MKIGHRFSFFIFQLAEKMNDPKIHAFTSVQLDINQRGKKKRTTEKRNSKISKNLVKEGRKFF